MAIAMCDRCDKMVDLDWNVEDMIFIGTKSICIDCATEEELDTWEKGEA